MRMHYAAPFSIYSLANNHVRDAGIDELRKTCKEFKANDILYVGGGIDKSEAEKPLFLNCKGVKIGILAFAQKENQIATENDPGAAELITDKVLVATERLVSQCDVPIVVMHEGYEFMDFPRVPFMELCRKLTTLGIKIVIGHHSHVPQGMEYINNAFIFYSLGNFLFDQPHFKSYPWSRRSFVPAIHFEGTQIRTVELRPFKIELNPLDIQPADPDERVTMLVHLKKITELIDSETKFREATNHFYTNILLPEFLGFIRNYGNQYNNDFSALIEQFKGQKPVHNVFADFLTVYGKD
jgi:poly-gamma-glutamate synthesis protein (capsule biosynthesis protein)